MIQNRRFVIDRNMRFLFAYLQLNEVQVLQKAGLPVDFFDRKVLSLSTDEYYSLWNIIAEDTSTELPLPLMIEQFPLLTSLSVPVMAALCSPDFVTFSERIREYKPLIGPLILETESTEDSLSLSIFHIDREKELHPLIVATEMVFFVKMIREATGVEIVPARLESVVPLDDVSYEKYFGVKVKQGPENRFVFSMEDALRPFRMSNERVWNNFEPELRKRLHELETDSSFAARVRAVLMELLPLGRCSIDSVADKLCISSRTLQRKLKNEKTNYQQQLNHSRELLGKHYLSSSDMNITEISFLLGFEEPSSFSRAFHLWTGESPEAFRMNRTE
ncbi:MAG: helix-turn-helix domain-containing protein [Spirochaetales bacterium]|nr:helix-turn-helix domain-containing protein [Spirochaetales bacterium]